MLLTIVPLWADITVPLIAVVFGALLNLIGFLCLAVGRSILRKTHNIETQLTRLAHTQIQIVNRLEWLEEMHPHPRQFHHTHNGHGGD